MISNACQQCSKPRSSLSKMLVNSIASHHLLSPGPHLCFSSGPSVAGTEHVLFDTFPWDSLYSEREFPLASLWWLVVGKNLSANLSLSRMWQFKSTSTLIYHFKVPPSELLLECIHGCHPARMTHPHLLCQFVFKGHATLASFDLIVPSKCETGNTFEIGWGGRSSSPSFALLAWVYFLLAVVSSLYNSPPHPLPLLHLKTYIKSYRQPFTLLLNFFFWTPRIPKLYLKYHILQPFLLFLNLFIFCIYLCCSSAF